VSSLLFISCSTDQDEYHNRPDPPDRGEERAAKQNEADDEGQSCRRDPAHIIDQNV